MIVEGHLAAPLPLGAPLRLEVEEGADHAEQDDGRRLGTDGGCMKISFNTSILFGFFDLEWSCGRLNQKYCNS